MPVSLRETINLRFSPQLPEAKVRRYELVLLLVEMYDVLVI
jgi:hypothetical protein